MPAPQGRYWMVVIGVQFWTMPTEWATALPAPIVWIQGQQEEGGTTGYRHYQMVLSTSKKVTATALKSLFCNEAHLELTKSAKANDYCFKDDTAVADTRFSYGKRPFKRNSKRDWDKAFDLAKSGRIEEIADRSILVQHYGNLRRIAVDNAVPKWRNGVVVNVYWGVSGSGKTHRAFQEAGENFYIKNPHTKWWDSYKGEENIIIDEFNGQIQLTYLLLWFDKYPCMVEQKGSQIPLKAIKFWVTSNKSPDEWYSNDPKVSEEQRAALRRRLTNLVHFPYCWFPDPFQPSEVDSDAGTEELVNDV